VHRIIGDEFRVLEQVLEKGYVGGNPLYLEFAEGTVVRLAASAKSVELE